MGYILTIYSETVDQEFILPVMNNADYSIVLPWKTFSLFEDVEICMEVFNNEWRFVPGKGYRIQKDGNDYLKKPIADQQILTLTLYNSMTFAILVRERENAFFVYSKYLLPPSGRVTIGQDPGNDICYDARKRVSGSHAAIEVGIRGCVLYDTRSKNGVYVNHVRIRQSCVLRYGDTINIVGLKIVYLGSFLAIDTSVANLRISEKRLSLLHGGEITDAVLVDAPDKKEPKEKTYFNRVPRSIEQIDTDPFEIEAPPGKDQSKPQPWYLTVGPALTMAIPMTLGCLVSIMGSGSSSSVFMYTGLITAFGSAIIGACWGVARLKYEKKRRAEEEAHRLAAYEEYLDKTETKIRERYEEDQKILLRRYPSADILCAQREDFPELWNRNATHQDFMYYRLGIGKLPFPSEIRVPPERFKLWPDELTERPGKIKEKYENLEGVPVGADLLAHSLIGVVGGTKKRGAYEVIRLLLAQIAYHNCYTDVKIAITWNGQNSEEQEAFGMFRWLPHTWSQDKRIRYTADDPASASDVYYALTQVLRDRGSAEQREEHNAVLPMIVLVVTDISSLNNELISKYIFDQSAKYGLVTLLLAERYEELPNSCEYIISNSREPDSFVGVYSVRGEDSERIGITFDSVLPASVEDFARRLSGIEVEQMETGGEIPNSITFFEMMGINKLEELDVLTHWMKNRTYDSMRALLGQKAGGAPCYLDVHEKYHGPHGLVAGTTGSGKSETLQTYMLSLAINYSPDDIGFFIIDYKGGGMANLFNGLPHLMGQISNLSGNQVRRAMVSIKSENRRRQRIFNEHGVNNINSYTKLVKNNEAKEPVPHLFIIIDEFAELKREEPDFMRELISVAQVGRSLGVHLILATQKPSGTVDDNIWSNSKFRLCLRVQDKQDSNDMLHKPDAAYITQAGRGYLQVGNDELYELFQSGWSGAAYDESGSEGKVEAVKMYTSHGRAAIVGNRLKMYRQEKAKQEWISRLVQAAEKLFAADPEILERVKDNPAALRRCAEDLGLLLNREGVECPTGDAGLVRLENLISLCAEVPNKSADGKVYHIMTEAPKRGVKLPETGERTQLDAVVSYLAEVAKENGFNRRFLLWLPVLPETLYLAQLEGYPETAFAKGCWIRPEQWELKACIGLMDDPANQSQTTLEIDFAAQGHLVICGAVGTGKSTFLQTLTYSLIHRYSPEYINLYCMDFSSNALRGFEKSAHVGGVMYESDLETVSRCFNMLDGMLQERRARFKGGNYEQYVQSHGMEYPAIFLMIDNYANFREKTANVYEEQLVHLSRDGAACGIYLVITAAGFGLTEVSNHIGKNIKNVICLEMGDKFQYADVLHTMKIPLLPESGVRGRGLVRRGENVLEYQTALPLESEDDYARIDRIAQECQRLNDAWTGRRAKPVPCIPDKAILEDLTGLEEVQGLLKNSYSLPVGYNFENAQPYCLDLREIFSYLISGRAKSGKKNMLKVVMAMAVSKGLDVKVIDFSGRLRQAAESCQAEYLDTDRKLYDALVALQPGIIEKNTLRKELETAGAHEDTIYARIAGVGLTALVISDLTDFISHVTYPEKDVPAMAGFLENITDKGAGLGLYFFCCCSPEELKKVKGNAICTNLTRKREGMHFGGNVSAQQLLNFEYISYKEQSKAAKPGVAMLPIVDGEVPVKRVVVPYVGKREEL